MPFWNNNDAESSKPNWLSEEQKRQCFRTVRGWEIPLPGFSFNSGTAGLSAATGPIAGGTAYNIIGGTGGMSAHYLLRSTTYIGPTELLVAMPMRPSTTGVTNTNLAGNGVDTGGGRGASSWAYWGFSGGAEPNYTPYITNPVTGQSLSYVRGVTAYIPLIGADANMTDVPQNYVFGVVTAGNMTGFSFAVLSATGFTSGTFPYSNWLTQRTTLTGQSATGGYWDATLASTVTGNVYGGWGGFTNGSAVLRVFAATGSPGTTGATGSFSLTATINDGRGSTGTSRFTLVVT